MITLSVALPFKFWAKGVPTFNESKPGFILFKPYYHQSLNVDNQKLQLTDTDNGHSYYLYFTDDKDNLITSLQFEKTVTAGLNVYDLEFAFNTLPVAISDRRIRMYIYRDASTFDDTFDFTFDTSDYSFKTDLIDVLSQIDSNMGWGSQIISYRSLVNYYSIQYPNDGAFFNLRIPCRFYSERIQETVNELELSETVFATSRTQKFQTYLEPYQLPAYVMKQIAAALSHDVTGSVQINGVEYQASDSFDWSPVDPKSPLFKGKIWLTDKNNFIRNII